MLKILTADELAKKTSKGTITTIYGLPDSGKSTFMISVAEKMKVLFIDSEGKFGKICQNAPNFEKIKNNISGIEVKTLKGLIDIVKDPAINNFDAVIIDSVTQLVDKELHDIQFVQRRRRSFDDYSDLGTNFMGAVEILKSKGISSFFTIQAKTTDNYNEPDAQGGLVAKKAIEASDWMFFIEEGKNDERTLSIKNSMDCRLKKKGIPNDFPDQLIGDKAVFSSLWSMFPSKNTKEENKNDDLLAKKKSESDQKAYINKIKSTKTMEELKVIWKEIISFKVIQTNGVEKAKNDQKIKLIKNEK